MHLICHAVFLSLYVRGFVVSEYTSEGKWTSEDEVDFVKTPV